MRAFLLTALILSAGSVFDLRAQLTSPPAQVDEVQTLVQDLVSGRKKVSLLTRDLVTKSGKVMGFNETLFELKVRKKVIIRIPYDNVLEISGGGKSLSFVPDRATRNYGEWDDVGAVYPGTKIALLYKDGKAERGFSHSVTRTHLVMFDKNGRERVDVPREQIVAVYGLVGGYGGVKAGASKGAEGITSDRDMLPDFFFAGVGALLGMAKSDGRPILIYSR